MMGMEKMMGSMIGFTPEELKLKVGEFETFIKDGSNAMIAIANKQNEILAAIERIEKCQTEMEAKLSTSKQPSLSKTEKPKP